MYEELLTQQEIQYSVDDVNSKWYTYLYYILLHHRLFEYLILIGLKVCIKTV